uniref:Uncharacterized protein n=1 Tax=Salix viminalis TaxID=40686 RepID=A0A6N2KTL9_SALVM
MFHHLLVGSLLPQALHFQNLDRWVHLNLHRRFVVSPILLVDLVRKLTSLLLGVKLQGPIHVLVRIQ